jgi:hypothetical protein
MARLSPSTPRACQPRSPAELAKFRARFAEFEAGRVNKKSKPQDTARRLGRIAGRTFADIRKRLREP